MGDTTPTNKKHEWFRLSKSCAIFIMIYLSVIILLSSIVLILILLKRVDCVNELPPFSQSIILAIASSLLGASLSYSRKLYKACINLDMIEPIEPTDQIRQVGIISYYLLRPLYSACLSVISCVAMKSSTEFITKGGAINENFPYLVIIVSFFVGYSSSHFIDSLEAKGKKFTENIFSNK